MDYEQKLKQAEAHAQKVKEQQELYKIRHQNDAPKKITTTKLIILYLFIVLNVILIFSMITMVYFADLSSLSVLITDIAAQVLLTLGYFIKATRENTVGGIVYETTMKRIENDDDAVG